MHTNAGTIHADQRYLQGLAENSGQVIKEIYERFAGKVTHYILQNNGMEADAADIFQEALLDIYQQARHKGLQLTCPFEAFFLLVCKRKWFNKLKKKGVQGVTIDTDRLSNIGEDVFVLAERMEEENEKSKLFLAMFEKLGEKCREIIRWCLGGSPQEEIAAALGVTYGYLRKKKSECMATLIESIRSHQKAM